MGIERKIDPQQFFFSVDLWYSLFEMNIWKLWKHSLEHCCFDQVCDILNKADLYGSGNQYIVSQTLSAFH